MVNCKGLAAANPKIGLSKDEASRGTTLLLQLHRYSYLSNWFGGQHPGNGGFPALLVAGSSRAGSPASAGYYSRSSLLRYSAP